MRARAVTNEQLCKAWQESRDPKIRDELLRRNMGLIRFYAEKRVQRDGDRTLYDDLIQEGCLGFIAALDSFDESFGIKLSTYASQRIRARQNLVTKHPVLHVTTKAQQRLGRIIRAQGKLDASGIGGTSENIAAMLGLRVEQVEASLAHLTQPTVNLNSLIDYLPAKEDTAEETVIDGDLLHILLAEAYIYREQLDKRDRAIFDSRLLSDNTTRAEIGQRFGVTHERIRQREAKMLPELRKRVLSRIASKKPPAELC